MPVGSFFGDPAVPRGSSSPTGTGPASVPRGSLAEQSTMAPAVPRSAPTAGGSGYTTSTGGAFGEVRIGGSQPGATGLYGLPGQNPNTEPSPLNLSRNNLLSAQQLAQTMYGPQQQLLADQLARQQQQLGMVGIDADYKTGALNRDAALQRQGLGLDRQALGVDRNLTNTQLANLQRLRGILGQRYGIAGEQLANQLSGFKIDEDKARDMRGRHIFDLRSQLTARGAFNTVANERGTGRINRDLSYQLREIGVGRKGADIGYRNTRLGLDEQGIGYDNQAAGLNARLANLGIDASRLGLSEARIANSLADGLHQIGLDSFLSINGLLDAMGGTNQQQAQLAATIFGEVANYANLPPDVLKALQAALGVGATAPVQHRPGAATKPGLSPTG